MTTCRIISYRPDYERRWDEFVAASRNGTFLHSRAFMDYHGDRFDDRSVLIIVDDEIAGVFPCHGTAEDIVSHNGLTFGGLVYGMSEKASLVCGMMNSLVEHFRSDGFHKLIYKAVPHVFHSFPAEEDLYALSQHDCRLIRRDLSAVIPPSGPRKVSTVRKRGRKKAENNYVTLRDGNFYEAFHALLVRNLENHETAPVHTLPEMDALRRRVGNHVKLLGAFDGEELVAGTWLFLFDRVIHTQYICSSERGRKTGALDMLLFKLLDMAAERGLWVSFGASTEQEGRVLNFGLVAQKEGFGARGMVLDHYKIDL